MLRFKDNEQFLNFQTELLTSLYIDLYFVRGESIVADQSIARLI